MFLKSYAAECASTFKVAIGRSCFATEMSSCRLKHKILNVVFILCSFRVEAPTALHALVLWIPDFLHISIACPSSISLCWGCERLTRVSLVIDSQSGLVRLKVNVLRMNQHSGMKKNMKCAVSKVIINKSSKAAYTFRLWLVEVQIKRSEPIHVKQRVQCWIHFNPLV